MINPLVANALPDIRILCERQGVQSMSLFGSATSDSFSPTTSDVDFVVKFFDNDKLDLVDRYLDLAEGLERTLHRPVDLVTEASIRNPIFRKVVEQSKILIYDASITKIPH